MSDGRRSLLGVDARYGWWLTGIGVSLLGSSMFGFALTWTATATSGTLAGLVNTVGLIPGLVLVLIGGAVSDRHGPWWVMVIFDTAMVVAGTTVGVLIVIFGTPPWLLIAAAVCVGTANSFYIPASAVVPRLLVGEHELGRAMAARGVVGQVSTLAAAPLGGIAVVTVGLATLSWFDAATYAVILLVLILSRHQLTMTSTPTAANDENAQSLLHETWEGILLVSRDPLLRPLVIAVSVVAGILLPLLSVLVPLLVRKQHWEAHMAGMILGAELLGSGLVSLLVLWRGLVRRSGLAMPLGLLLSALGCFGLASAAAPTIALIAGLAVGAGIGTFTSHVAPVVLGGTVTSHLSRVQAVLLFVQMVPVLITANVFGISADRIGPQLVATACGIVTLLAAAALLHSPTVRTYQTRKIEKTCSYGP